MCSRLYILFFFKKNVWCRCGCSYSIFALSIDQDPCVGGEKAVAKRLIFAFEGVGRRIVVQVHMYENEQHVGQERAVRSVGLTSIKRRVLVRLWRDRQCILDLLYLRLTLFLIRGNSSTKGILNSRLMYYLFWRNNKGTN